MTHLIVDISGLWTERRKWMHYFDDIPVLMFIVALSDYDQIDIDDTVSTCNIL